MLPQELILTKRRGGELTDEELAFFFGSFLRGEIPDYQMSALLMAVCFSGMTVRETAALTRLFVESGSRIDLSDLPGVKVDKHSTGGVGDKTSLLLLPIVAAAGVPVPMISGRGLGHTGGTLDKFESIPGFRTRLSAAEFREALGRTGMAVMGQTDDIVPMDRRIYALRDVTATIDCPPLIVPSIMSKKIAGGADALVLDIKTGGGAFMDTPERARELAALLARTGSDAGLRSSGFITGMSEPLGFAIGNWLEVVEVVDCLTGRPSADLMDVTLALAGAMLHAGGAARDMAAGRELARRMVAEGRAYAKFLELVASQGGDTAVIEETLRVPAAPAAAEVLAERGGVIAGIDARSLGLLAIELGAGRKAMTDAIDPAAGIVLVRKTGDSVEAGDVLCRLYAGAGRDPVRLRPAARTAFAIGRTAARCGSKLLSYFDENGFVDYSNDPIA